VVVEVDNFKQLELQVDLVVVAVEDVETQVGLEILLL
jgi:hypothetical protein